MGDLNVPAIVFALSSLPAFLIARMLRRGTTAADGSGKARLDRRLARLMEAAGVVGLLAAAGLLWAGGDRDRAILVIVAMVVLVNAMIVAVLFSIFAARRKTNVRP